MSELWKVDPTYTNYVPTTAEEAVERFVRCRNNGLKPMLYPECLIQCSRGLDEGQIARFEEWIINPGGPISGNLVHTTKINDANDAIFAKTLARVTSKMEDEKLSEDSDDEKLPPVPALSTEFSVMGFRSETLAPVSIPSTSTTGPCPPSGASD